MKYRLFSALFPHDASAQTIFTYEFDSLNSALEGAIKCVSACKKGNVPAQTFCIKTDDGTVVKDNRAIQAAYSQKLYGLPYK